MNNDANTTSNPESEAEANPFEAELAKTRDELLRALAEVENTRRRAERQSQEARAYGIDRFARDLLPVADTLTRAIAAVPPHWRESADEASKNLLTGLELTERSLHRSLEKNGVKKFDPMGEKFDPNVHQAMYEVPDNSVAPGTVVQVIQTGYMIGDRMLRPALVGVSKAEPKPAN